MMATPELMRAFHFTEADLNANKHGYLTKEQRKQLQFSWKNICRPAILILLMFSPALGLVILLTVCLRFIHRLEPVFVWTSDLTIFSVFLLILAVTIYSMILSLVFYGSLQIRQDLRKGLVAVISGRTYIHSWEENHWLLRMSARISRLRISHLEFAATNEQQQAITPGDCYSIYYLPISGKLLSIEQVLC